MHTTSIYHRLAAVLAVATTVLGIGFPAAARAADFPSLNSPAATATHPGKFVWAELFTSDSAAAAKFYTGVFGWTATTLDQHGVAYTVFTNGNLPVAGLRQRSSSAATHGSRWINYISVTDIAASLSMATKLGAVVRAPARAFPNLGTQAIITDGDGAPVGLIQSSSGDPADDEPAPGGWNWFHLFVKDPQTAADFYRRTFKYEVSPDTRSGKPNELLLTSGDLNRGGVSTLPGREDAKPGWLGVIRVADIEQTVAKVPALGGEVMVAPRDASYGSRFAVIADPTGGSVGVVQYVNNANPVNRP